MVVGHSQRKLVVLLAISCLLLAAGFLAAPRSASATTLTQDGIEIEFWQLVNQERVEQGLPPLHLQLTMSANAQRVIDEALADDGELSSGEGQLDTVPDATLGTDGQRGVVMCCGAVGFGSSSDHLVALLESPNTPLLSAAYTHIGIATAPAVDPLITQADFFHIMIHLVDVTADAPTCQGELATISGTDDDDIIYGTESDDVIVGYAGRDRIKALGGNDLVCGGDDIDYIWGFSGDDTIWGEGGSDRLRAGPGDDELWGGSGADRMWGQGGEDFMQGQGGQDFMWGGPDNDTMQGSHQSDEMHGGGGDDDIRAAGGKDLLFGDEGDDVLFGGANTDALHGGAGGDQLFAGAGTDTLFGGADVDLLNGQKHADDCIDDLSTTTFVSCSTRSSLVEGPTAAQWLALRLCESGDVYDINTGNGYFGAYQFSAITWDSLAATEYPELVGVRPDLATPAQQDAMALRLFELYGAGQWPSCGSRLSS